MVRATMMAPRIFPRNRNRIMTTRMMPSVRFVQYRMSGVVHQIAAVDEWNNLLLQQGRMRSFSSTTFLWIPSSAVSASAPFLSSTMPDITSPLSMSFPSSR